MKTATAFIAQLTPHALTPWQSRAMRPTYSPYTSPEIVERNPDCAMRSLLGSPRFRFKEGPFGGTSIVQAHRWSEIVHRAGRPRDPVVTCLDLSITTRLRSSRAPRVVIGLTRSALQICRNIYYSTDDMTVSHHSTDVASQCTTIHCFRYHL